MPTLDWIGKKKVVEHHLSVPYRILERRYEYGAADANGVPNAAPNGDENLIIRGDNLDALKSLLPRYEGRIKCVYIDPPYNTGNEGWVYNDNVADPKIRKWLGEVVGKEGEDLSRHDKWLCMMYPRLRLLQRLLADDGAIFISIDDNEQANLKLICDEIFGIGNFVANVSWQRNYSTRNDSQGVVKEVEYLITYGKKANWNPNKLPRTDEMDAKYQAPDNDDRKWTSSSVTAPGGTTHQGMVYAIQHPFTGEIMYPTSGRHWSLGQAQMLENLSEWCAYELKDLSDFSERAKVCGISPSDVRKDVMGIVLSDSLENSRKKAQAVLERGKWPYFYFTNGGKGGLRRKTYLGNVGGRVATNFWQYGEVGHTDEAKKELNVLFNGENCFDTPKPTRLIERVLQIATDKDSIILDSFAGSGTTAHAVLKLNQADGGNRKFILIETEDYAETITAERVKRVIDGYGEGAKAVPGTGGSFAFCELGEPLLQGEFLNENATVETIREYVYFTETKRPLDPTESERAGEPYLLGICADVAYYFYYEKDRATELNAAFLKTLKRRAGSRLIYADVCRLSERELTRLNIRFKKIPRDISRL